MDKSTNWTVYATPHPALVEHALGCLGAGAQHGYARSFSGRALSTFGLVLITSGSGHYFDAANPSGVRVTAPALVWLFPGVEHGYGPEPSGWSECWVVFDGGSATAYEQLEVITRARPVQQLAEHPEGMQRAVDLLEAIGAALRETGSAGSLRATALLHELLASTAELLRDTDDDLDSAHLLQLIARDAALPLSLAQRAERIGLSEHRLRRLVRVHAGTSPIDYVLDVRMARARELLALTDESVRAVGLSVGYDDAAYFSRVFSRRIGVAPSAFREQQSRVRR